MSLAIAPVRYVVEMQANAVFAGKYRIDKSNSPA